MLIKLAILWEIAAYKGAKRVIKKRKEKKLLAGIAPPSLPIE